MRTIEVLYAVSARMPCCACCISNSTCWISERSCSTRRLFAITS